MLSVDSWPGFSFGNPPNGTGGSPCWPAAAAAATAAIGMPPKGRLQNKNRTNYIPEARKKLLKHIVLVSQGHPISEI